MAILGHSQIAVTMDVYTHVVTEDLRAAAKLMDELLGFKAEPVAAGG